jgi:putative ABC transport system permease protein
MFKNMLKRAWLSTVRKPSRTVIVGLILFAMANLVLAAIVIKNAVGSSMDFAKSTVGGTVLLSPDMEKVREKMHAELQAGGSSGTRLARPTVPRQTAEAIANSDYVKDYTFSLNATANADGLTAVESDARPFGGAPVIMMQHSGGNMAEGATQPIFGDFSIYGINSYAFISDVKNGAMSIVDGEYFDEKTDDAVIISKDLADKNSLKVGDKITLKNLESSAANLLTVRGIYDSTSDELNPNALYMNVATTAKFLSGDEFDGGNYGVSNVQYFMTNAEFTEQFIAEAKAKYPGLEDDALKLDIDTAAYEQMVGPIESVGSFATTILWVVVIASVVIITLIVTINVKDRRYEMGVLLSLGAKKSSVVGQVLIELVIVGTLAFGLSIPTSTVLARAMGDGLLQSQIAASQNDATENYGRPGAMPSGGHAGHGQMMSTRNAGNTSDAEAIDTIDITSTPRDYALLFGIGYLIIVVSLIVPTANVLRFQPKTILTGKE